MPGTRHIYRICFDFFGKFLLNDVCSSHVVIHPYRPWGPHDTQKKKKKTRLVKSRFRDKANHKYKKWTRRISENGSNIENEYTHDVRIQFCICQFFFSISPSFLFVFLDTIFALTEIFTSMKPKSHFAQYATIKLMKSSFPINCNRNPSTKRFHWRCWWNHC